ncbi:probable Phosphoenolpyruvate carboxykinase [ATP] [Saccharomycodes ludwigii]|uniref:Phosphoenolpyruvate carboxykinase (ATP) n=1 Tax=Saccharomycodes ludwigii TaxID=36035 RepID=A0A376B9V4_9ASCO|nr:hypothetical protein SCDLUD_005310 [Saccharomycodes ludwigii]KAH3898963.1 hypothetical protein SCDLUD_005310 [Saccharomycodes ludwigii]SSD61437.1 probable Phosphoenolpyruvate carboxykinase [ATP] [Saccharomycodes ludwigii]
MTPNNNHKVEQHIREQLELFQDTILRRNAPVAVLYEDALKEKGSAITSSGALVALSGDKTGRSPRDKRVIKEDVSKDNIWWGPVNIPCSEKTWNITKERAADYLRTKELLYVVDAYAGWDPRYRIKVRVVCARAYHALFMTNMLVKPTKEELENFGDPDFTIWNAGQFPANKNTEGMTSKTTVEINFKAKEMVICGTEYAGEMKKGIFSVMFYMMPINYDVLTLHSSCNVGVKNNDVTLFFGLSGTGKTTLSADPHRLLIGDDEHCWSDHGVFCIEGGCYAKVVALSAEKEPEIFDALKYGSVLENVVYDKETRVVDYNDTSITENTRGCYPIDYIPRAHIPCMIDTHPSNIILLTCDAFGILPPVSKLTPEQVMYNFITGFTSIQPSTEVGVSEPIPTFSACYGQPFLTLHPTKYASMLAEKISHHKANAWLINTGWTGASYADGGKRCPLKYTRAILDAIHDGSLANAEYETLPIFNFNIPKEVKNVPSSLLNPLKSWGKGEADYMNELKKLANKFTENFKKYEDAATPEILAAGPKI